jgi:SAM-dependent methyltransferase
MELINRNCSVCNSNDLTEVFHQKYTSIAAFGGAGYSQTIVICKHCGFTFSNPSPAPKELTEYYRMFSNYENPQRGGKESKQMLNKWRRTYDLMMKHFPPHYQGKALEIGCATATGLAIFKSEGWTVLGIEPSPIAAQIARELYDIEVISGLFDSKALIDRGPFDAIILSHVLEHLLSPQSILSDIRTLLDNSGLVYIEVPNLLRPFVPMGYLTFEHLNYFTPTTLSSLMKLCGFTVEIELYDNSADIEPFYPVIAAVGKRDKEAQRILGNDYGAAHKAINDYKQISDTTVCRIQSKIDFIMKNTKEGRLGIWGAGIHTSQLLSMTSLAKESIACVFDNDSKKHGKRINGVNIIGYENPESVAEIVDAIIISSKASEDEIYNQIKHLQEYGIGVYKLYEE